MIDMIRYSISKYLACHVSNDLCLGPQKRENEECEWALINHRANLSTFSTCTFHFPTPYRVDLCDAASLVRPAVLNCLAFSFPAIHLSTSLCMGSRAACCSRSLSCCCCCWWWWWWWTDPGTAYSDASVDLLAGVRGSIDGHEARWCSTA